MVIYRGYNLLPTEGVWVIAKSGQTITTVPTEQAAYEYVDKLRRAEVLRLPGLQSGRAS